MESLERTRSWPPHEPGRNLPDDVDRPGAVDLRGDLSRGFAAFGPGLCWTPARTLVHFAAHRMVDQPSAGPPRSAADGGPDRVSAKTVAQDLGVLRDLCRPRRSLAAAR